MTPVSAEHESRQKITAKTLEKAVSDCAADKQYEISDLRCGGLQLRVRGSVDVDRAVPVVGKTAPMGDRRPGDQTLRR